MICKHALMEHPPHNLQMPFSDDWLIGCTAGFSSGSGVNSSLSASSDTQF